VDLDGIVGRVDIDAIAKRIDLDAIVEKIDIDAIVSRLDLDAIVDRVDIVGLAEEVVNGIDLPEIIRESTGTMASEVVRDARMQSIVADVTIARLVDRLIHRRRARRTDAPGEPESLTRVNVPEPTNVTQTQPLLPPQPEPPKQELRR
jgi:predicted RNase H-like nuclease